jgi:hypothetical protein
MFLEQRKRLAPSAAKCSAMALPIPFDAPLMTTFMAMIFSKLGKARMHNFANMKAKQYEHLFFDLDHTLWDFDTNSEATLRDLYAELRLSFTRPISTTTIYTGTASGKDTSTGKNFAGEGCGEPWWITKLQMNPFQRK